ncbi:unnamed protein product [Linum trigynum]|uniref:RNase H type-1 domain-containing protein n=1 Tax=Linum trigynum TaxID=586398 RepID=A0AAV2D6E7_9ROSI
MIPVNVCNTIDRINRDFIWGKDENQGKMHLVAWEKLAEPRTQGGGGLRALRHANLALLAKGGWRILQEKETLWTQIMRAKYGGKRKDLNIFRPCQGSSFAWSSINKAASLLKKGCAWNIHNGKSTNFWLDNWILQEPLVEAASQPVPEKERARTVASYMDVDGRWDTTHLSQWLSAEIIQKITAVMVDALSSDEDQIFWKASADGRFTMKTAYLLSQPGSVEANDRIWKGIWKLPVPERVRCFTWLVLLGRIATNVLRFCRRCSDSPNCARCEDTPETVLHVLRDCPPARFCWSRWVPIDKQTEFFHKGQEDWLRSNLTSEDMMESGLAWNEFFSIAIWLVWRNKCIVGFKGVSKALTAPTLAHSIQHKALLWHQAWEAPSIKSGRSILQANRITEQISWQPPSSGWHKLNIDGASAGNPGTAGAGGVIRDEQGRWIAGFVAKIGEATAALAELWAFYHGLESWMRQPGG